ncbi:MAG: helix-turn-helix transcriptional regulator [Clostridia bacterium]|nr:helix-turn-helix transcriptional regulator [Clostridia bacterium]
MRKSDFLNIEYCHGGLFTSEAAWTHSTRCIQTYEIIVVTKGTVYIREEETEYAVNAGEYLLLYPDRTHGGTRLSEMPVEFFWLHFTGKTEEGMFAKHLQPYGALRNRSAIVQLVQQILHYQETPSYPSSCCDFTLYMLLCELMVQSNEASAKNVLAERVHEYIRSHGERLLSVQDVAKHFGYNVDYLSRVMKACYGKTLQQEIVTNRLQRAKYLLQTSQYTVDQIARELGYDDPNLFIKFFRYHEKTAPTAYRNRYHKRFTNHI